MVFCATKRIQKKMKKALLDIVLFCLKLLRIPRNVIILESVPDFSGSPKCIADEVKRRSGDKYRFFWAVEKEKKYLGNRRVLFFWGETSLWDKVRKYFYLLRTAMIVDSNRPVKKICNKTIRIWTNHGGTLKKCRGYRQTIGPCDYVLSLSKDLAAVDWSLMEGLLKNKENVLSLGHPANDEIFISRSLDDFWAAQGMQEWKRCKIIGWFPTFRQHQNNRAPSTEEIFPFGLPLIKTAEELMELDAFLLECNCYLVVQMHHSQKKQQSLEQFQLKRIVSVSPQLKCDYGVSNANLMNAFDGLITDYSGAYHEYILLDRPIAVSIDDLEEYQNKVGFCYDFFKYIKGFYLKNFSDLRRFVKEISEGEDSSRSERLVAKALLHQYSDNHSTQRVVDFISTQLDL